MIVNIPKYILIDWLRQVNSVLMENTLSQDGFKPQCSGLGVIDCTGECAGTEEEFKKFIDVMEDKDFEKKFPEMAKEKHRHRRNVTSHHFTSFLFTSLYIHTSLALISLHFSLSLLLSIERQKQYKYIKNIATGKTSFPFNQVPIFSPTHPDKFEILWNQGYTKS